jgi:SAM-dependent methyltransferase
MFESKEYELLHGKNGLEIGGPTFRYGGILDLYKKVKSLDGVNFSTQTIWEGTIIEGQTFKYREGVLGYQYICESTDLNKIKSNKYDFVLSCNSLEHIANPLKAVKEWLRIIKKGGLILLILPDKESNFDHKRKITKFKHLLDDYENDIGEDDLSHLGEELLYHDLPMTPECGDLEFFMRRSLKNYKNRCLHQHVFDMDLLELIFKMFEIEIVKEDHIPSDFIILGRK